MSVLGLGLPEAGSSKSGHPENQLPGGDAAIKRKLPSSQFDDTFARRPLSLRSWHCEQSRFQTFSNRHLPNTFLRFGPRKIGVSKLRRVQVPRQMRLRIVIADDNPEFLERFVSVLKAEFDIVGTAKDGLAALELAARLQPDVAVLDIEMPGLNGIEVTRKLSRNYPSIAIVICSVNMEPDVVVAAREAGARGYVFKSRVASDLVSAVKAAASGTFFTSLH